MSTANNNTSGQTDFSAKEYWTWETRDERWGSFLAEIRTRLSMAQRQVSTKQALARELVTVHNRDVLAANLTTMGDLADLEATVTDAFVAKLNQDEEMDEKAKAEEAASQKFTNSSDQIIKAATKTLKSVSDKIDERNERDGRRDRRRLSQDSLADGQHHSDPPNKVTIASDLKPEQLSESVNQLELEDWTERAECYAEASNILNQSTSVQFGYLQALVSPSMWQLFKEYCEAQMLLPTDIDFEKGLDLLKETYFKKNDIYTLRLKTSADTFKGKSFSELQSWFFKFRQKAKNCGLSTMTEEEMLCFRLITAMSAAMQHTLFVQNPRPSLQEALDYVDNQVMVENMTTNKPTNRKSDTVHNIQDSETPFSLQCWICNGAHKREACTVDKKTLKCESCGRTGHATQACRGGSRRTTTRSSSRTTRSRRSSSSSSESSSSSRERRRRKKKKDKDRKSRDGKKSKNSTRRRASSATSANSTSASDKSRGRSSSRENRTKAGRTPKPRRKKRDNVNTITEESISDTTTTMRATRMVEATQKNDSDISEVMATLDTGSKFNIADRKEVEKRSWKMEPITEWETPSLRNPDGSKLYIIGKVTLWLRLAKEKHKRAVEFFVTPRLQSKFLIGLIDLKRLHWVSPRWPQDIEKWSNIFTEVATQLPEETVNKVDDENDSSDDEDDEDEKQGGKGTIEISDFTDLKTHHDIPGLKSFPTWLQDMIEEYPDIFTNELSAASIMNVEPVTFSLREDIEIPNKNITAHLPPANLRASADRLLDKLENGQLIGKAPRQCKYKSKAFFKPKKNNEARLLVDYKASQVNKLIERPVMPQLGVEQLISQVKPDMNFFISGDITGAYFCYPLKEGPQGSDLTCFLTHRGKYVFKVLPMGCVASQDYLAETLTEMLDHEDLKEDENKGVIRLVDDIAGFTHDEASMKKMARTLFSRCRQFNVKLNPTKFQFSTEKINFGGMVISKQGVLPDPERMKALAEYPTPSTSREVKSFLGCATSLASFTSVLLQDCRALRALTKKGAAFHWGEEEDTEFKRIIARLTDPSLLHHYDVSQPLAIDVDTSIKGVGYTAYMFDEARGPPGPNNAKLIKCGSAAAKPSWANYSPIELEASGTLLAVRKMDHYLINNTQVVVRNDHLPFVQAYNSKDISQVSPRLRRIFLELAELNIKLTWAEATSMMHVDAMSRHPVDSADSMGPDPIDDQTTAHQNTVNNIIEDTLDDEMDNIDLQVDDPLYASLFSHASQCQGYTDAIRAMQEHETINWKDLPAGVYMKQLKDIWPNLHIVENSRQQKLFVLEGTKFIVPPAAIPEILEVVDITHMGFPKAIAYARARYYWPKMTQSIETHCNSCLTCIQHSQAKPAEDVMPPVKNHIPSAPFEVIFCDEFSHSNKAFFMIVDSLSNYSRAYQLHGRRTASVLINHLLQWQLDTGFARVIGTDGAKVFTGEEFQTFLADNKIEHRLSAPMRSASNGKCEERVKAYKNMLTKLHHEGRRSEADARETWELLQNMPSKPGSLSPARIAFRRERRHPLMPCIPPETEPEETESTYGREQFHQKLADQVKRNSKRAKNVKKPDKFVVGQRVLTQKYTSGNAKRDRSFTLPAKVIAIRPNTHERSAILQLADGKTTIRDRLHCCLDPSQPQPDIINNIASNETEYLKLIPKPQDSDQDNQQMIDTLLQKCKARGAEVQMLSDTGPSILVTIKSYIMPRPCLRSTPRSGTKKSVRFNIQVEEEP